MTPPSSRTVVCLLLATVGLGGLLARPAAAADWTVQAAANQFGPDRQSYGYTINPGGNVDDGIVVVNHGATRLSLTLHAADGFNLSTGDAKATGVGAWVHPDRDDVTVGPGESIEVPFAITLPDDAAPGDYVGGLVASSSQDAKQRVGIRMNLRVGGALKPSLSVENVQVHYSHTASPIGKGDATVAYTIHNTGNAILSAKQQVSLSGPFGRWKAGAGAIADTPPLAPGDTRKVSARLHDVTPALRLTATVTLVPLLTDAAGSTAPLPATKTSAHAWTIPWTLLLAIVVVCGLVVAGARRLRRRIPIG